MKTDTKKHIPNAECLRKNAAAVAGLDAKAVWKYFAEISSIPRGSANTARIADYLVSFAEERGLEHYCDESNNVIIIKPASEGAETAAPLILQGHTDMVCEKERDCKKDMAKEGLELVAENDFIYAKGTTLGADDGIAVALILELIDDDTLRHPRLEAVFTSDEEIGMLGAAALDISPLKGETLINLDSEDEGVFTVGCAGGRNAVCRIPVSREEYEGTPMKITVSGLAGGHSGVEIDKGRGNADKILGRALYELSKECEIRIVSADGGLKDNAIPRFAEAVVRAESTAKVWEECARLNNELKSEYRLTDGEICVEAEETADERIPMTADSTGKIISVLMCIPNGVRRMNAEVEGAVETSLNLGILRTEEEYVELVTCIRSGSETQKNALFDSVECVIKLVGGAVETAGDYPGWEYRESSPLRDAMCEAFEEEYGYAPKVETIHAGLECGIFCGKFAERGRELDCVSCGPQIDDIHTVRERMSISSAERTWRVIRKVIEKSVRL